MLLLCFTFALATDLRSIVDQINSNNELTWKAKLIPRFAQMSDTQRRGLNGAFRQYEDLKEYMHTPIRNDIPEEFDSQTQWPNCKTIDTILEQGHCGSCWAFASHEILQDRFCIHSHGEINVKLSAQHMTSCATGCYGCQGGWPQSAFSWVKSQGIVVDACIPYQMGTCTRPNCTYWDTPKCNKTCYPNATLPFNERYFVEAYGSIKANEAAIQTEIMTYGPVTCVITVYDDFFTYASGVYTHVTGKSHGLHAVKIVGWGVLNGVKYWKIANSWNTDFGMSGFILMKRGTNECGVESSIDTAHPKL